MDAEPFPTPSPLQTDALTQSLKDYAQSLGFDLAGVCRPDNPAIERFQKWLENGYAGEMHYLPERVEAYAHPDSILKDTRSLLMLTYNYPSQSLSIEIDTEDPSNTASGYGRVSRYASGERDYHDVVHKRLKLLAKFCREQIDGCSVRGVIDTAPLLERDYAVLAGIGWQGKNTLLLNKRRGSSFFLAALLLDVELSYDPPHESQHCGTCRACLDVCPTDAFPQPFVLDARKCISYLTIELRGPIPPELRPGMQNWVFGCDLCQDVCPWNRHASDSFDDSFLPRQDLTPLELTSLFDLTDEQFRERFRRTPLWRTGRKGLLRNAAIALGNQPNEQHVPALNKGLNDVEPLIRGAAAWALGRHGSTSAVEALNARLMQETDSLVKQEIEEALG